MDLDLIQGVVKGRAGRGHSPLGRGHSLQGAVSLGGREEPPWLLLLQIPELTYTGVCVCKAYIYIYI